MELLSASRGFLKCNFHCHTTCSDGRLSPKDVMAAYRALDYDVLAITDHREVTRPAADEIPAGRRSFPAPSWISSCRHRRCICWVWAFRRILLIAGIQTAHRSRRLTASARVADALCWRIPPGR